MNNPGRKLQLAFSEGPGPQKTPVMDIVPKLNEFTVPVTVHWWSPGKERSLWLSSFCFVLLGHAVPLAWWLRPDVSASVNSQPPAAMVVELAPAPVAPRVPVNQPPSPQQADATPPRPDPELMPEPEPELPPLPEVPEPEVALKPVEEPSLEELKTEQEPSPKIEESIEDMPLQAQPTSSASASPEAPVESDQAAAPNQGLSNTAVDRNRLLSWQSTLMMKLNEAKRYPFGARRYRQEGVAYLRFVMDREGNVLSANIERSSGYPLLDEETLALIERAQPLPKPPESMASESFEIVVPVEFFLNR